MPRWLPLLALSQVLGIAAADVSSAAAVLPMLFGGVALAAGALARSAALRGVMACLLVACAGALGLSLQLERASHDAALADDLGVSFRDFEAEVRSSSRSRGRVRAVLDRVRPVDGGPPLPGRLLVTSPTPAPEVTGFANDASRARAAVAADAWPAFEAGVRLRVRARLKPLRSVRNPGERDWARARRRAGIGGTGRLVDPALVVVLNGPAATSALDRVRAATRATLASAGPGGGLLASLGIGDRGSLSLESTAAFSRLGLSHLLAVSGLHVGIVAGLFYAVARWLLAHATALSARASVPRVALAPAVVAGLLYGLVTGWGIPAQRAAGFLALAAAAVATGRVSSVWHALALASLGVLTVAPDALFLPGAQLSFAACAGLFASASPAAEPTLRFARSLSGMLRTTASASAATAPLVAWHFAQVAPGGLLANLVGIPWTALVMLPLSLFACACAAAGVGADAVAIVLLERVAAATLAVVEAAALRAPDLSSPVAPAGWAAGLAALGAVGVVRVRGTLARVLAALGLYAFLAWAPPAGFEPDAPRLLVLDVGQGDAVLVDAGDAAVLVDAGSRVPGGVERGRRTVVPVLAAAGIERLDVVIVTHADLDHRGGIPAVLNAVEVGEVWVPFGSRDDPAFAAVREAARARGVEVVERGAGSPETAVGNVMFEALWPPRGDPAGTRNDRSLVIRFELAGLRVLVPGDIEARAERVLIASGVDLRSDILVFPHHGSRTSSSAAFLDAIGAVAGVASAPCHGRFGMPHRDVLDRARQRGMAVWWTGRDGAVIVTPGPVVRGVARDTASCSRDAAPDQNR